MILPSSGGSAGFTHVDGPGGHGGIGRIRLSVDLGFGATNCPGGLLGIPRGPSMRKETGVYQRHTRRCPSEAGARGYAEHKCTGTWTYVIDVGRDSNSNRVPGFTGWQRSATNSCPSSESR